jgi:hypothetical protein
MLSDSLRQIFIVSYFAPGSVRRGIGPTPWSGQLEARSPEEALQRIKRERPFRYAYTVHLGPRQDFLRPADPRDHAPADRRLLRIRARPCRHCRAPILMAEDTGGRWHALEPLPAGGTSNEYQRHECRNPDMEHDTR